MANPDATSRTTSQPVPRDPISDPAVATELFPIVYDELRGLAAAILGGQRDAHTLQPTALVHEAYMRLRPRLRGTALSHAQLKALAARVMRTILIDHARAKARLKRGGGRQRISIIDHPMRQMPVLDVLAVDEALSRLAELSERKARLVECRCLAGMTVEECSEALGIAPSTAYEDWSFARAWLSRELRPGQSP